MQPWWPSTTVPCFAVIVCLTPFPRRRVDADTKSQYVLIDNLRSNSTLFAAVQGVLHLKWKSGRTRWIVVASRCTARGM